ncbi:RidA family protein [Paenibacillus sp. SYP-B4298]|uniref:RidA family protein n=1 Tax=Paenibacillus sp. SYP-B4298 TaxID=2996034 RepID=UPI0022DD958A|nr:RidA family protein [Paenibacillus sp. SYP-B4298]
MSDSKSYSWSPYEREIGFSRAIRRGQHFFVAGTASIGRDGHTVSPDDVAGQTRQCMQIIGSALADLGLSFRDITRTRILLTDIEDWKQVCDIHRQMFGDIQPVCTVMEVSRFIRPEWKVEIEAEGIILCEEEVEI